MSSLWPPQFLNEVYLSFQVDIIHSTGATGTSHNFFYQTQAFNARDTKSTPGTNTSDLNVVANQTLKT
jgi:hypothetical protein